MAIYTTQAARQRKLAVLVAIGFVVGLGLGTLAGRLTAPTVEDQVAEVRGEALAVSPQLHVLSLHSEAGVASLGTGRDSGADLALRRADEQLGKAFDRAPWITNNQRADLRQGLTELQREAPTGAASPQFAARVDQLAVDIDRTFGGTQGWTAAGPLTACLPQRWATA